MINKELIKAIWASGFRSGLYNGIANATAYEWGSKQNHPEKPPLAWSEDIEDTFSDEVAEDLDFWENT